MTLLLSMALRNARRNVRRTLLTAITIALGVGLLTAGMAWTKGAVGGILEDGANTIGPVRIVTKGFAKREQLMPLQEHIADVGAVVEAARTAAGVTGAWARIQMPATVTVGENIGENFTLIQGAEAAWFERAMDLDGHLVEGRMFANDDEAVVGRTVVEEAGATLGDELVLLGMTQDGSISPIKVTIVGISDLGSGPQNKLVYIALGKAQWMADIDGGATEVLVYGTDREVGDLAQRLSSIPALAKFDITTWKDRPPFNAFADIIGTFQTLGVGAIIFITALGVLNTMLMSVLERTAEIGVMRAMGLGRAGTVLLFVMEAMGIASIGGTLGALGGALFSYFVLEVRGINLGGAVDKLPAGLALDAVLHGDWEPYMLVFSFLLGLVVAIVGSAIPALRAASIDPVEAMRARR